ncbi:hypothetical protein [Candidatus Phycosocius spiralis]|uniref:DUF3313 domain-containing protein n=1 Tax=Candidatus Phycosocius spiralis TaxID=2815099 RepID=A0ABQ4PWW3_9PROT|nr:hypothetical protein [Candidatus Phycosocius spiralis]GIU67575.1 hypothetical protein PsB1_1729 [Candidatus Phycosocius spiralis]
MRFWFIGLALCVVGCVSTPLSPEEQSRLDMFASRLKPPATLSGTFSIVDQRKRDATKFDINLTGWAGGFSCFDGVTQLGDSVFAADRIARLENALAEAFPGQAGNLIIRRYDIYLNQEAESSALTWSVVTASFGLYGGYWMEDVKAPKIWRAPKCGRDRMHSGWFDPSELTNNFPPITVEIDVNIFGQDYSINAATSSEMKIAYPGVRPSPAFNAMLQSTMDKGNSRLINAIRAKPPAKTE